MTPCLPPKRFITSFLSFISSSLSSDSTSPWTPPRHHRRPAHLAVHLQGVGPSVDVLTSLRQWKSTASGAPVLVTLAPLVPRGASTLQRSTRMESSSSCPTLPLRCQSVLLLWCVGESVLACVLRYFVF